MVDSVTVRNAARRVPLAVLLVLTLALTTQAAIPAGLNEMAAATPLARPKPTDADVRLRSAYLMRQINRYAEESADARRQLQRHFQAVLARLEEDGDNSLSVALDRLEAYRGEKWRPSERAAWRERLAQNRLANMTTLKEYQLTGRFPINRQFALPTPIFVDQQDTACAVGYLMRQSGWSQAVEAVAQQSNFVFIDDVAEGPVLEWILHSGLTKEEAALIQPAYRCDDPPTVSSMPFSSGSLTLGYTPKDGTLSMNIGDGSISALEIKSAEGRFRAEGADPDVFTGAVDVIDANKLFLLRSDGLPKALTFGTILPPQLAADEIIADLSISGSINLSGCDRLFIFPDTGIVRWDDGQTIAGTEEVTPQPHVELGFRQLSYAWLGGMDLEESNFESTNLSNARLSGAMLKSANFADANLSGAYLDTATLVGTQLPGANLTNAVLFSTVLEGANLSSADLREARFFGATLKGADVSEANLTAAAFFDTDMTSTNLSGANLKNADFSFARSLDAAVFSPETTYNQWTMFPDEFDPSAFSLTLVVTPPGDLDGLDGLTSADVDLLGKRLRNQLFMSWQFDMFDFNGDAVINADDLDTWVYDLKRTWYGDANLDGQFDSSDLIDVLADGQYEDAFTSNSTWASGDWNADGEFDSSDLLLAFQDGGYEQGPRAPAAAVPESASGILALLAGLSLLGAGRSRR